MQNQVYEEVMSHAYLTDRALLKKRNTSNIRAHITILCISTKEFYTVFCKIFLRLDIWPFNLPGKVEYLWCERVPLELSQP